ncbi:hypothetical protein G6F58_013534 [Rhizopus delemar]|nr:hypothetical protein G6F58_013534 [Rhizopus delemar]
MPGVPWKPISIINTWLASSLPAISRLMLGSALMPPRSNWCSFSSSAALGSRADRMAAALAGLSSRITPTMMCRSCTLPASTHGRAASQNLWQYGQLASLKV